MAQYSDEFHNDLFLTRTRFSQMDPIDFDTDGYTEWKWTYFTRNMWFERIKKDITVSDSTLSQVVETI
jgi:hypothetical protein